MSYTVTRHYLFGGRRVIKRGLTLAEARRHCRDPETSSSTAKSARALDRTRRHGPWFDGYKEAR